MKKLFLLLIPCLSLLMTACRQQDNTPQIDNEPGIVADTNISDEQDDNEDDITNTSADNADKDAVDNNAADNNAKENDTKDDNAANNDTTEAAKRYYGTWNVISCISVAPVSALSPEEIEQLQGTTLTYEENRLVWNGEASDTPTYQENTETSEEFTLGYNNRLSFSDLGLTGSEATVVTVDNCDTFGNCFYIKDENTLVVSYNGAFFEASRNLDEDKLSSTGTSGKLQLYEGSYFDSRLFSFTDQGAYPKSVYEIVISNVTDTAFDFALYEKTIVTGESVLISPAQTAVFSGDGTEAAFSGADYNLIFAFPDYHETYPVVTDIEISGFKPLEGNTYVNNAIPGYEFS